jgi:hypothetical protein
LNIWPEIIVNRNALVAAAPRCRISKVGPPFVKTARSQGQGCGGAAQSLHFGLASAAHPSSWVLTVLSAATVVRNVLALDRWSQIALPSPFFHKRRDTDKRANNPPIHKLVLPFCHHPNLPFPVLAVPPVRRDTRITSRVHSSHLILDLSFFATCDTRSML